MRSKSFIVMICAGLAMLFPRGIVHGQAPKSAGEIDKLGAFLGDWNTQGEMKDSQYSKAQPNTVNKLTCNWAPNHRFLVCDQIIHTPSGVDDQVSLYTYNEKQRAFAFIGVSQSDPHPHTPTLTIEGKVWTYSGEFHDGTKRIQFRTTNEFTTSKTVVWRSEYSEDGSHWTLMGEGTDTRID